MSVVGVTAKHRMVTERQSRAAWLARDLLAEIGSRPCAFHGNGVTLDVGIIQLKTGSGAVLGDRDAELASDRSGFNDIFDYDNWESTPPVEVDGTPIPGFGGWTRRVDVDAVDPVTLADRAFDPGCAKVEVTVLYDGVPLHTETVIRSAEMDRLREPLFEDADGGKDGGLFDLGGVLGGG
jgi:hypothetical protein